MFCIASVNICASDKHTVYYSGKLHLYGLCIISDDVDVSNFLLLLQKAV